MGDEAFADLIARRDVAARVCRNTSDWLAGDARREVVANFEKLDREVQAEREARAATEPL